VQKAILAGIVVSQAGTQSSVTQLQETKMSRGMPSMTALLGMLALAGYQNKDKLMEMFNNATSGLPKAGSGGPAPAQSSLTNVFGGLLGGGGVGSLLGGGLNELFDQFKKNGQGDAAESWVGTGPNKEISPPQVKQAIGQDVLTTLEQQTGLSQEELLARLSRELPTAIDKYTPDGQLPSPA
jgi:uncharacterized protein YidB (DUF937 family)